MEEQAWGLPTLPAHLRVPLMDFVEQGLQNLSPEPGASMLSARGSPVPHKEHPGQVWCLSPGHTAGWGHHCRRF